MCSGTLRMVWYGAAPLLQKEKTLASLLACRIAASAVLAASAVRHHHHRERWHISSYKAEAGGDGTAPHFYTQILLNGSHCSQGSKDEGWFNKAG